MCYQTLGIQRFLRLFYSNSLFLKFVLFLFLFSLPFKNSYANNQLPVIAITQIVEHSSLDKVRQGILDKLKEGGYEDKKTVKIVYQNAQGNRVLSAQIAQQFVSIQPEVIVAIATPSAQALVGAAKDTKIPIVFATVTDPIAAKLVTSLTHPGKNVTGTRNVSPINEQLLLIKEIIPHIKTLGIILNYAEENSVQLLKMLSEEAQKQQMQVKSVSVVSSSDVKNATMSLLGKADAILLLQDNTVASALPALMQVSQKNHLPIFSMYVDAVKAGALAGLALEEYAIGRQTGEIIIRIIQGEKPGNIAVVEPQDIELAINLTAAKNLGIIFNQDLLQRANKQYSGKRG